jgi:hypothetical protein
VVGVGADEVWSCVGSIFRGPVEFTSVHAGC